MDASSKTTVQRLLEGAGIAHRVATYDYDEEDLSAGPVALKIGMPLEQVWKTLALRGESGRVAICCLPSDVELDLKKAARALGEKKVAMLPLRELEPETGYLRGGCSPIGLKRRLPVLIDETVLVFEEVSVSAGRRGVQVILAPADLVACSGAALADLT